MKMSNLSAIVRRPKKRLGRGHGSGKVKTSGRGTKGQKARDDMPQGFEGGQVSILRRLPLLRGKGRNKPTSVKPFPIEVGTLETLPEGTKVTLSTLEKYHMIKPGISAVKILGGGKLSKKLTVAVICSQSARQAIEKAGGTVEA
jgi:large subunit ribosomal protein L15